MTPNESAPLETSNDHVGFEALFGFQPPATLHFDDSGQGGLKVKYARITLPVAPSQATPVADFNANAPRSVASA